VYRGLRLNRDVRCLWNLKHNFSGRGVFLWERLRLGFDHMNGYFEFALCVLTQTLSACSHTYDVDAELVGECVR